MSDQEQPTSAEDGMRSSLLTEMVGGLSHELAQPLNAINLACEVIRLKLERSGLSDAEKQFFFVRVGGIKTQVTKASLVIDQFRRLFSDQPSDSAPVDLEKSLNKIVGLLGQQLNSRGISLSTDVLQQGCLAACPGQAIELAIAQCVVFVRCRLEQIRKSAELKGSTANSCMVARIENRESTCLLQFRWNDDCDELAAEGFSQLVVSSGILETRDSLRKHGGELTMAPGLITIEVSAAQESTNNP